ncbi:MAG: DUF5666 domain-containing protein, partial [Anaerolineales bacterium]
MNNTDLLQEALARLEAGEPLDKALPGLPAEDAEILKLAAALQAMAPARAPNAVAAQRQQLLHAAQTTPALKQVASRLAWIWPVAITGAFAVIMLFFVVGVTALAGLWWWNASSRNVAQSAPQNAVPTVTAPNPETAALQNANGNVEVQASDGTWQTASNGATVKAGQRVRTGALSGVTLAFYDGSRARLGPNSEVVVDTLNTQKSGARVIALTQVSGESDHEVAKASDPSSQYTVATPSGTGSAQGTAFHVSVTTINIRFDVSEGAVAVSNVNVTVIVIAGHSTVIIIGQPPTPPMPRITGEGQVQEITPTAWRIAGQTLNVNESTLILGEPLVGDWVSFEGRLLPDGTRVADRITLLHRNITNTFNFIGAVEVISDTAWTISGRAVRVDAATLIEPGIAVSDTVEVIGVIAADGALQATAIRELPMASEPFTLTGVVQTISDTVWAVSGLTVTVTPSTTIEAGIVVSDVVRVTGFITDGVRVATAIQRLAPTTVGEFEFTGIVISRDPWNVSGIAFETDDDTEIDDDIRVGNRVRVEGRVLSDGTRLAEEIEQLDNGRRHAIQFTARVQSIDPWIVGGVALTVDDKTKISGDPQVGDLVTVKGNLLPDGTVIAKKITRVSGGDGPDDPG